jgi:nucleotide-binding universal stress UspA family protein
MKRILVPTDFSANADKAVNFAVQIAKRTGAEIAVIHAYENGGNIGKPKEAAEKLELIKNSIAETERVNIITRLYTNSPVDSIINAVADVHADFIVMGTLGSSGIKEMIYGSRTGAVIGKSPVPVLAVPLLSEWDTPKKILLAINQFSAEHKEIDTVFSLASLFNASVQVAVFTDIADDFVEDYDEHEVKVATLRNQLKEKYPAIEIHAVHLSGRHFRESLQHWIDDNKINILVMLTHKRKFLESVFNSSMTKKMSYHSNIPLLAIPVE